MRLILIGFMGAGKSTIGELLSKRLVCKLVEMDQLILERSGLESIDQIFQKHGEKKFRELENAVAQTLMQESDLVISTGGGVVTIDDTMAKLITKNSRVIFLRAKFEALQARVSGSDTRPLFRDIEKARELFNQREALYQRFATYSVDTDQSTPQQIAEQIALNCQSGDK